ncbi:MAG TPA: dihydrodipicolinate synthase family protein [Microlunatus sp.]|nr:dihydrodipicolinate synthase family protein [Microlunatus sp.]
MTRTDLTSGVTVPVVTPLAPDGPPRPDGAGLERLFAAFAAAGVRRIMLLGSNGEGPLVPTPWLGPFVTDAVAAWHSLAPENTIVVNVSAPGTAEVLLRAEAIADAGADGLACTPPSYFPHRADEVVTHFTALTELGRPVIIYHTPARATPLTEESITGVLELPGIVGFKDSSGDLDQHRALLGAAHAAGAGVAQGGETEALAALRAGADGLVLGVANFAPALVVELVRAVREGRDADAEAAQKTITELTGIHRIRRGVPSVKAILAARGLLATDRALPPLIGCTDAERDRLEELLAPYESVLITGTRRSDTDVHREPA